MAWTLYEDDCFAWLAARAPSSVHAVLTDPPYGVKEFEPDQVTKLRVGRGGLWRVPPTLGGRRRNPLPRFTVLDDDDRRALEDHFARWGALLHPAMVPGGHALVAANVLLAARVQLAMERAGFEYRGAFQRLYRGLRGGDRPKGAEGDWPEVMVTPRGAHEPWLLFRKPLQPGLTVAQNLSRWKAGALRRPHADAPMTDVVISERTPLAERRVGGHPTTKPQSFLRPMARMLLPLGEGVLLDPFAGSGSTLAAATAVGVESVGVERDPEFAARAREAIPALAALSVDDPQSRKSTPRKKR